MDVNSLITIVGFISFIVGSFLLLNYNFLLLDKYQNIEDKKRLNNIILTIVALILPFASSILVKQIIFFWQRNDMDSGFYTILGAITGGGISFIGTELNSRRQKNIEDIKRRQEKLEFLYLLNQELSEESESIALHPLCKEEKRTNNLNQFNKYIIDNKLKPIFENSNAQKIENIINKIVMLSKLYFPQCIEKIEGYKKLFKNLSSNLAMIQGNLESNYSDNDGCIKEEYIDRINNFIHQAESQQKEIINTSKELERLIKKEAIKIGITPP